MKMPGLISAAAALLLLTGCGASSDSGDLSLSPNNVWNRTETSSTASVTEVTVSSSAPAESPPPRFTKDDVPMNRSTEYFYDMISEERLKQGSLILLDGLRDHNESISFKGLEISEKELNELFDLLLCCDPELGWIDYNYKVDFYDSSKVSHAYFTYKLSPEEEKAATEELRSEVSKIAASAEGLSDFDKVLGFHDYIITNCDYSSGADSAWSAYGCLIDGKAVCEGYSKALIALCEEGGILCIPVSGTTGRGGSELHMWNKVMMDGEWYNMDLTWDDPTAENGSPVSDDPECAELLHREYFGFTDEAALADHSFLETNFLKYPEAVGTQDNYFIHTKAYLEDPADAAGMIYSLAAHSLDDGETAFQLRCADKEIYESLFANEFAKNGTIFDILTLLNEDGYPVESRRYRYITDDEHCILTVILAYE